MEKYFVGCDAEFMAYKSGKPVYPILGTGTDNKLRDFGCDEFGHCVEARPTQADNVQDFIINIQKAMAILPEEYGYRSENIHIMDKADFIKLLKAAKTKRMPECKNIYDKEILDDCKTEIEARANGKRIVFCGTHIHVSKELSTKFTRKNDITGKNEEVEQKVTLPLNIKALTYLFDHFIFSVLREKDKDFNAGRYRSAGFYEEKSYGGFEYRSLGSTVFTPKRMFLIAKMVFYILNNQDDILILRLTEKKNATKELFRPELLALMNELKNTEALSGDVDLRTVWTPWK